MISIEKAILHIKATAKPLFKKTLKDVKEAGGYNLYETVYSPIHMPPFRQSAMDGYALNMHNDLSYNVIDEVKAGDGHHPVLDKGEAVRIFTGAPVPATANAVIIQEKVKTHSNKITIAHPIAEGCNIRPLGEQVKKEDVVLKKGTTLIPAAIGYLTSLGITNVSVYKKPSLALITTGHELIEARQPLTYGKIYESNSTMLLHALQGLNFYDVTVSHIEDEYAKTISTLRSAIQKNDLVLISGGISVGDHDFVKRALDELRVTSIFYKIKQKPGKPLYFGKKDNTLVFALPGNPASALTCFYVYVYIALQKMMDKDVVELPRITATSISHFTKKGDRPQFLKAVFREGKVEVLDGQQSSTLHTFACSNALVFMPAEKEHIHIHDLVEVIVLPV